jgi:hypothetical protein
MPLLVGRPAGAGTGTGAGGGRRRGWLVDSPMAPMVTLPSPPVGSCLSFEDTALYPGQAGCQLEISFLRRPACKGNARHNAPHIIRRKTGGSDGRGIRCVSCFHYTRERRIVKLQKSFVLCLHISLSRV